MRKLLIGLAIFFTLLAIALRVLPFDTLAFLPIGLAIAFGLLLMQKSNENQKKLPKILLTITAICSAFVLGKTLLVKAVAGEALVHFFSFLVSDFVVLFVGVVVCNQLDTLLERATPAAGFELRNLLASPRFADSPALTAAAIGEFSRVPDLDQASALRTAATLTGSQVGSGLSRIERGSSVGSDPAALQGIANRTDWLNLDREAAVAPTESLSRIGSTLTGTALPATGFTVAPSILTTPLRNTATVVERPVVTDTRISTGPVLRATQAPAEGAQAQPGAKGKGKGGFGARGSRHSTIAVCGIG